MPAMAMAPSTPAITSMNTMSPTELPEPAVASSSGLVAGVRLGESSGSIIPEVSNAWAATAPPGAVALQFPDARGRSAGRVTTSRNQPSRDVVTPMSGTVLADVVSFSSTAASAGEVEAGDLDDLARTGRLGIIVTVAGRPEEARLTMGATSSVTSVSASTDGSWF